MTSDDIKAQVASIARRTMEVARSHVALAVGNTLSVAVPLEGIQLPDDMADLVRSVATSTGFQAEYRDNSLYISLTNTGSVAIRPDNTTLSDIHEVLQEILAWQVRAAQRESRWNRQDTMAALNVLLALITAIVAIIALSGAPPQSSDTNPGRASIQAHSHPSPGTSPSPSRDGSSTEHR
jgi:hypothetical protein